MDKRVESMQVGVDIQERLRRERDEAVRLLRDISPQKLRILADYVDMLCPDDKNPEVQRDLRGWARKIEEYLAAIEGRE